MTMFDFQPVDDRRPVIVAAYRTAIARSFSALDGVNAELLVAPIIKKLLQEIPVTGEQIDDVILGNATGGGGNIARLALLTAGLPVSIAGVSVDRQCGSGLEAIILAARLVQSGAGECYLAGGVESTSTAPWRAERPRKKGAMPRFFSKARFAPDTIGDPDMGVAAENVARLCNISRARQDEFALQSHQRAVAAIKADIFSAEIVAVETANGLFSQDECPRPTTSQEALAALKPAFVENGTVTAGNSCPLNDGGCVVMVMSARLARAMGLQQGMVFIDAASAGVDPNILGLGPVPSTEKLLARQPDFKLGQAGFIEFNEAFAAQVLASLDQLGIDSTTINREGGAIALGHPFGASGGVLVTRLLSQMKRASHDKTLALAMIGIGGGMGLTALFQWAEKL